MAMLYLLRGDEVMVNLSTVYPLGALLYLLMFTLPELDLCCCCIFSVWMRLGLMRFILGGSYIRGVKYVSLRFRD